MAHARCMVFAVTFILINLFASALAYADLAIDDTYQNTIKVEATSAGNVRHAAKALKKPAADPIRKAPGNGRLFVEFRGEFAYFPGNTSMIYGTLGPDGEPAQFEYASFQPANGVFGLLIGSIIPWKHYVGAYPWDNLLPPMMSYRVSLTGQQYRALVSFVERTRHSDKTFYLYTDNCVRFVRDAARAIGLSAPEGTFILPPIYVNMLRIANSGR